MYLFSFFDIREDYEQAQLLPEKSRDFFYNNIKAGAESGWDFSNRWCIADNNNRTLSLLNISTQHIIPVDLNAILQQNARLLGEFHSLLGNNAVSRGAFIAKPSFVQILSINSPARCCSNILVEFEGPQRSLIQRNLYDKWISHLP